MPQLLTIQAARGVAANLVVLSHLSIVEAKYTRGDVLPACTFYGIAGVDLFFVLSGFIMVAVAGHYTGPVDFLWRRATRIYPTYWLISLPVLALAVVAPAFVNSSIQSPISLWRSFLLVPDTTLPLLAVGWTLVHEMYFYLVFSVFLALRIPVSLGIIGWGAILVMLVTIIPDQVAAFPALRVTTSPLTAEFMMGAIVGVLWARRWTAGAILVGMVGVAELVLSIIYIAPILSLSTNPHLDAWRVVIFGIPSAMLVYTITGLERLRPLLGPKTLMVALGDWSYSTYLVHVLVISAVGRMLFLFAPNGGVSASVTLIATGLVAANLVGAGLHSLFERPVLNWLHEFGARHLRVTNESGHAKV
jgi:exopolysaccharide production protein ExoZ